MEQISFISYMGTVEKEAGCINQDRCLTYATGDTVVIGISDGAGSKKWSHLGAEKVTMLVMKYIAGCFEELYKGEREDVLYKISREIVFGMEELAKEYEVYEKELGATLSIFAKRDERYIAIHLGDGMIGKISVDSDINIIARPECRRGSGHTFLTSSKMFQKHLKLYRGDCDSIKTIFMMTDGMIGEVCKQNSTEIKERYMDDIKCNNIQNIDHEIHEKKILDDHSFISLQIQ